MRFLSKLHRLFQTPPEMFRNVSRGTDARLSGSTPGPAVVNAGMGNYFEALRQSKDRTQPPYMAAATATGRIFGGLNRKQLAALGRYLVDSSGVSRLNGMKHQTNLVNRSLLLFIWLCCCSALAQSPAELAQKISQADRIVATNICIISKNTRLASVTITGDEVGRLVKAVASSEREKNY